MRTPHGLPLDPADAQRDCTLTLCAHSRAAISVPHSGGGYQPTRAKITRPPSDMINSRPHSEGSRTVSQGVGWIPDEIDISVPSMARIYDYMLGGAHNFPADRQFAEKAIVIDPTLPAVARACRATLGRMIPFLIESGVRQFIDCGSGIPTSSNVHQIAQNIDPSCRILYVDNDPIAVAHSELMLADNDRATMLRADLRDPAFVLSSPEAGSLLNLNEPVALLFSMILHWIPDAEGVYDMVRQYREAVPSDSHLAIFHAGTEVENKQADLDEALKNAPTHQVTLRTRDQLDELFGEFELVEPGLVSPADWRPRQPVVVSDEDDVSRMVFAGVGRKP
ncbi:hypothetical protein D5S17_18400 [Pseudonocardiaceae bacterium YIM PH 21723]|nr:hypothetical protein D5S17_18400 [Pseudonocardiaceae bacterium YIM PH 21723]